jgi:predicted Rossmann fold flavoprotein
MTVENESNGSDETNADRTYDVVVLGGGAAGLMCAITAGQRGKRVLLLELSNKLGKKILMSGGGRCNFTNLDVSDENFICDNPHFVKSALNQYTQWDFISMVAKHGIAYHEKTLGQLFCYNSAKDILAMLVQECREAGVVTQTACEVTKINRAQEYAIETANQTYFSNSLVVATGGLSIPTLGGASGFGYQLAEQFGLRVNATLASLVPFTLSGKWQELSKALSGVAVPVHVSVPEAGFSESMLFTHRGLSGPAILQLSNYWQLGQEITINLFPSQNVAELLLETKKKSPKDTVSSVMQERLPRSLVQALYPLWWRRDHDRERNLAEYKDDELNELGSLFNQWRLTPSGTEGYRTAEVTMGGVEVNSISSKTMEVHGVKGLYFVGEVLDVTGHLGGFNFQWAWSSGYVAGLNI